MIDIKESPFKQFLRDTLESFLEDPQQLNPYSYARNNPMRYTDPTGENIDFAQIQAGINAAYTWAMDLQRQVNQLADNNRAVAGAVVAAEIAPGTGDVNDFYSAIFGRSLFTGQQLSPAERFLSVGGAFLPFVIGGMLVKAGKGVLEAGGEKIGKLANNQFSKKIPEFFGGKITEKEFLDTAENYLGSGYREISSGRYVSADGLRQVRFGPHEVKSPSMHGHFEAFDNPGGRVIENTKVDIISE